MEQDRQSTADEEAPDAAAGGQTPGSSAEEGGTFQLVTEMGPLVAFFVANWRFDIFVATGVFMVAILVALAASWHKQRRLPVMPLVTAVFVLVFGGLTLWLQNEVFIKLKPTILNTLFAAILLVGLLRGQLFLKIGIGQAVSLDEAGWRKLTVRWSLFFLFLAVVNEIVHRNYSTDFWVSFKSFGMLPLTLVFSVLQLPLLQRHALEEGGPSSD